MKVNELGLYFDEDALYRDLIQELLHAVHDAATDVLFSMKAAASEVLSDDNAWFVESVQNMVYSTGIDQIIYLVGAQHWYAFLDNYGTGSLMDKNNPWLQDYINSGYFNEDRLNHGMAILGRPAGTYEVPDFRSGHGEIERESLGALQGLNLEQLINPRTKKPYFIPTAPKHWLEKAISHAQYSLEVRVKKVFDEFNFASPKYLRGGIG